MRDPSEPDRYGRSFADVYDQWYDGAFATDEAVIALRALAGGGRVLELGVGTGRLAIPLARSGLDVTGIDASVEMIELLEIRRGTTPVDSVVGDMRRVDEVLSITGSDRRFALAFCAFNTILNLDTVDAIVDCLRATSALIEPAGLIAIEAFVPVPIDDIADHSLSPARVAAEVPVFVETSFDRASRRLSGRHVEVHRDGTRTRPWSVIVLSPTEIDELAERAGLRLIDRWSDWTAAPFEEVSTTHISIYSLRPDDPRRSSVA